MDILPQGRFFNDGFRVFAEKNLPIKIVPTKIDLLLTLPILPYISSRVKRQVGVHRSVSASCQRFFLYGFWRIESSAIRSLFIRNRPHLYEATSPVDGRGVVLLTGDETSNLGEHAEYPRHHRSLSRHDDGRKAPARLQGDHQICHSRVRGRMETNGDCLVTFCFCNIMLSHVCVSRKDTAQGREKTSRGS